MSGMKRAAPAKSIRLVKIEARSATAWPVAPPSPAELPAGLYVAAYRDARKAMFFNQAKIQITWQIVEPLQQAGMKVPLYATMPAQGVISPRCKYYLLWVKANGGLPLRGERLVPSRFAGYWRVRIEWTATKDRQPGRPIVVELIDRVAGGRQ